MEIIENKSRFISVGFAIFSMFFGAGSIIFPLILGEYAQGYHFFGSLGMLLSGVFVPLLGMLSIILFDGDYPSFFAKIGKWPGALLILIILCLIGPFGALPRCITIGHATLTLLPHMEGLPLIGFSFLNCILIFLFTIRPAQILDLLAKVLTPLLITSLGAIILAGVFSHKAMGVCADGMGTVFCRGFLEGYNTMDLLASFFFSSAVLTCLREKDVAVLGSSQRSIFRAALGGAVVAASLIACSYFGLTYLAARYSDALVGIPRHDLFAAVAQQVLGPYAGWIVSIAMFFAVFTTEIALATIFARYVQTLTKDKLSYPMALILTLAIGFGISTLQFEGIAKILGPVLQLFYPALIALAIGNLLSKLYATERVTKPLFYGTLIVSGLGRYLFM